MIYNKSNGRYNKLENLSFAHRIIDVWNRLDESIIACDSINGFKNRIDKRLHGRGFI